MAPLENTRSGVSRQAIRRQRGPLASLVADRMRELGLKNVSEFATYAEISESNMYAILNGRIDSGVPIVPKWQTMVALAKALERPTHELLYILDPEAPGAEILQKVEKPTPNRVPVYVAGCVGAGPQQLRETDDYIMVEPDFARGRDLVAFRVVGDSMAGGRRPICHDDIVVVDRNAEAENNLPVVARLKGNGYVVKRLRSAKFLDSTNPDFEGPHAVVSLEDIDQLVGRVVRVQSSF